MKNTKVLVVVVTKDRVEPECYQALLDQTYPDYSILIHIAKAKEYFNTDDKRYDRLLHTYLNCSENRNAAKQLALASDADHFLFVDADTILPNFAISELMMYNKDIIGGYYPINGEQNRFIAGRFSKNKKEQIVFTHCSKPVPGIIEVNAIGLGCVLISRKVATELDFEHGMDIVILQQDLSKPNPIEEPMPVRAGDCMAFGIKATEKGYKLFMNGTVVCKHKTTIDHYSKIAPKNHSVKPTEEKSNNKEDKKEETNVN